MCLGRGKDEPRSMTTLSPKKQEMWRILQKREDFRREHAEKKELRRKILEERFLAGGDRLYGKGSVGIGGKSVKNSGTASNAKPLDGSDGTSLENLRLSGIPFRKSSTSEVDCVLQASLESPISENGELFHASDPRMRSESRVIREPTEALKLKTALEKERSGRATAATATVQEFHPHSSKGGDELKVSPQQESPVLADPSSVMDRKTIEQQSNVAALTSVESDDLMKSTAKSVVKSSSTDVVNTEVMRGTESDVGAKEKEHVWLERQHELRRQEEMARQKQVQQQREQQKKREEEMRMHREEEKRFSQLQAEKDKEDARRVEEVTSRFPG
jgi:hypothetical protein